MRLDTRKRNEFVLFSIVLRIAYNLKTTGPIQVGFSAKCNEHFNQITGNRKLKMSHVRVPTDFLRSHQEAKWNSQGIITNQDTKK